MKPYNRKLFPFYDSPYSATATSLPPLQLPQATSLPPSSPKKAPQYNPPFDSSMALTVLVLLTSVFFMGFFSIYIRRFSEDTTAHLSRRRRYRGGRGPLNSFPFPVPSGSDLHRVSASRKGLDPTTIGSLPVYSYHGNAVDKYQIDCPICLSEFEEKQCLKTIPHCKHVFHVECLDTWLSSHISCPVCRGTRLFEIETMNGGGGGGGSGELGANVMQERNDQCLSLSSTVEISGTCTVIETIWRMRRASSCSSLEERPMLRRTLSS
ncbi:hypothetical protein V6N13_145220 [Hibiscus sabdariffa]|uniref:RING-type E3 ubiquitin transferase n=1 Tax=Hibiscus sabdariffa TaxID=183260 RepID=A0ABR2FMN7_9ROSI